MSTFFSSLLPYVSTVLAICVTIGGLWAVKQSSSRQAIELSKQAGEIQDRVISTQKIENESLEKRVADCEKEIEHLKGMIETTADLLKQKGFTLVIEGDTVTLEEDGKVSSIRKRPRPTLKSIPQKKETS